MNDELVKHVGHLSRIHIDDDEVEKYKNELTLLMDEINKINEVSVDTDEYLINTSEEKNVYRKDEGIISNEDVLSNAPKKNGNYIEVRRIVND